MIVPSRSGTLVSAVADAVTERAERAGLRVSNVGQPPTRQTVARARRCTYAPVLSPAFASPGRDAFLRAPRSSVSPDRGCPAESATCFCRSSFEAVVGLTGAAQHIALLHARLPAGGRVPSAPCTVSLHDQHALRLHPLMRAKRPCVWIGMTRDSCCLRGDRHRKQQEQSERQKCS